MLNDKPESVDILDTATTVSVTSMLHVTCVKITSC